MLQPFRKTLQKPAVLRQAASVVSCKKSYKIIVTPAQSLPPGRRGGSPAQTRLPDRVTAEKDTNVAVLSFRA
jgi:hypothetical protein